MLVLRHISPTSSRSLAIETRSLLIGRSQECDVIVNERGVADVAVTVEAGADGATCRITPMGASAVIVNGRKSRRPVSAQPGDRFAVGSHVLIVDRAEAAVDALGNDEGQARFDHLKRFAEAVGKEKDLQKLLHRIVRTLISLVGGTHAFIFKLDENGQPEIFASSLDSGKPIEFSDTVVQQVLGTRQGLFIPHALTDPGFAKSQSISDLRLLSVLCCPMIIADKVVGLVYLGSKKAAISYSARDLDVLSVYAAIAGMLINHVDFISQQSRSIRRLTHADDHAGMVAESRVMREVLAQARSAAETDMIVLIDGETGTGKDLLAQYVHGKSRRSRRPFVVVNCSSLQKDLLESELFGHKRGSFTGAYREHRGLFSAAEGGTLFLDEIGELDGALQSRILRTIETKRIRAVGAAIEETVNVRLICATSRDLPQMVRDKLFREDLYFRLNQFRIHLPPLRERGEDIEFLAHFFLEKYKARYPEKEVTDFHPESLRLMTLYDWPGNVRELSSVVHRAVVSAKTRLAVVDTQVMEKDVRNFEDATRSYQKNLVLRALDLTGGNKDRAAKLLGIHRSTIFRYLEQSE